MKQKLCRAAALILTLMLCLSAVPSLGEGSTTAPTETPHVTMSPAQRQSQGILTVGAQGDEVVRLQQRLKDLGYLDGKVDGKYGGGTKRAVIAFQRMNGLDTDGVAGQETLAKLYSEDAVAAPDSTPVNVLEGNVPILVNKTHTKDEFFTPADLVELRQLLGTKLVAIKYKGTRGVRTAVEALKTMLEAAVADGMKKWQVSAGYRTWDDQVKILNSKIRSYQKSHKDWSSSKARRAALRTVAEPGASEHHLGLAFDVNVRKGGSFASTKQSKWLNEHCWEYGFIIRYQKEKEEITGFEAEPWHIRYVGVEHAMYMKEHNLCLEEYVQGLEDGTIQNPAGQEPEPGAPEDEGTPEDEEAPEDGETPEGDTEEEVADENADAA